jgi:O-antigen ligase
MFAVALLLIFSRLRAQQKVAFLLLGAVGLIALINFLPQSLLARYSTTFNLDDKSAARTMGEESAVESSAARMEALRKSIVMTLQNPIFGVGPGNFMVAEAEMAKEKGERPDWLQTHNGYTQVSSETGLPGFILYMCALYTSAGMALRVSRLAARNPRLILVSDAAAFLWITLISMTVATFFGLNLYQFYVPVVLAMIVSAYRIALAESSAAAASGGAALPAAKPGRFVYSRAQAQRTAPPASRSLPQPPALSPDAVNR